MNVIRHLACGAVLAATLGVTSASGELLGSVHAGTYGDMTFTEIIGFELTERRMFSDYNYDIVIAQTTADDPMIMCWLYDRNEEMLSHSMQGARSGETRFHFRIREANATARCYFAQSERLTRPSGTPASVANNP